MHDINKIRNDADFFIKGWQRRGLDVNLDTILVLDRDLRKSITDLQELQTQRNDLSKSFTTHEEVFSKLYSNWKFGSWPACKNG